MRTIVLIKDFADKKAGEELTNLGGLLCSELVNTRKVAVYKEDYTPEEKVKKTRAKKSDK